MSALAHLAVTAGPAAIVSVVIAWIGRQASVRSAKITAGSAQAAAAAQADAARGRVEAEAYERAKGIYESALRELEHQAAGMRDQLDRLNVQVSQERDTSTALRAQIRALEEQSASMQRTISELRSQLATAVVDAARQVHDVAGTATEAI